MSADFVIVWRAVEGAAVQTYANTDKTPRVFSDASASEAEGVDAVDESGLVALLEERAAFEPKRVDRDVAKTLLGWTV